MGKTDKKGKTPTAPADRTLYSSNKALSASQNKISENSVKRQAAAGPPPRETGKSGYPHKYNNYDNISWGSNSTTGSTRSYYEYPVTQTDRNYDYASKPKQNPGPYRAITNQNQRYKGTICHEGKAADASKGHAGNPNVGPFSRATAR